MENGTAGWEASPPPQPPEASPSERWSQAWVEKFPGAAAHDSGVLYSSDARHGNGVPADPAAPAAVPGAPRAFPGPGPRVAASHRQQRARKLRGPSEQAPGPDETGPGSRRSRGRSTALLCGVLAAQAVLSLRLVWSNTASQDEATALWAGHLMWSHWLHGVTVPPFQAYLPGAPVIYPPLGALADHFAGLAGARLLSLAMMLGVTVLLWSTAARLFGRRAAIFGAALFAILGPVLLLGALATGDALSLLLLAVSTWCVVRAGSREDATGWMILSGVTLVLANAAAYASVLFDPVVILLALLVAYPKPGGKPALARGATILTIVATLLMVGTLIGGDYYVSGIDQTLSLGVNLPSTRLTVLEHATAWTGIVAVAALCAAVVGWAVGDRRRARMAALLAVAGLIVPVEQALQGAVLDLDTHIVAGAWFAAMAAGYAVHRLMVAGATARAQAVIGSACAAALVFPLTLGAAQSQELLHAWPNSASLIAIMRPLAAGGTAHLLVEDPNVAEYYLPAGRHWARWSSTRNIVLSSGKSILIPVSAAGIVGAGSPDVFAKYIASGYFSLIALNFADTTALDHRIAADIRLNHHYKVVEVVPDGPGPYVIWKYEPHAAVQHYQPTIGSVSGHHTTQPGAHRKREHRNQR
jgi:dolichyl-phosphate-mannose-protein mannosyltransferase